MGRGLSNEQKDFLALAWRINRLHGRSPGRGTISPDNNLFDSRGKQLMNPDGSPSLFRRLAEDDTLPDYVSQVFMHILYGIEFTPTYKHRSGSAVHSCGIDRTTTASKSACAALPRTLKRLHERGLFANAITNGKSYCHHIITQEGADLARGYVSSKVNECSNDYLLQCLIFADHEWQRLFAVKFDINTYHKFYLPRRGQSFTDWMTEEKAASIRRFA